ncbi:hypothetical protein XaC1_140 [Xanthomonas phage XaC1]|nr:hypothetical protein XaC1_140 [Xanthomonas phage XaC1]
MRDIFCAMFLVFIALFLFFMDFTNTDTLTDQEVAMKIQACKNESGEYTLVLDKNNVQVLYVTCSTHVKQ